MNNDNTYSNIFEAHFAQKAARRRRQRIFEGFIICWGAIFMMILMVGTIMSAR